MRSACIFGLAPEFNLASEAIRKHCMRDDGIGPLGSGQKSAGQLNMNNARAIENVDEIERKSRALHMR